MIKVLLVLLIVSLWATPKSNNETNNQNINKDIHPNSEMSQSTFNTDFIYYIKTPGLELLSNERIKYFYNLYTNSPTNSNGSCGYVSLIQYLSFYDCFYNDNIIPEKYERNQGSVASLDEAREISPGVLKQPYPTQPTELYSFIQNNMYNDYQMYLMSIYNESINNSPDTYKCSISMFNYFYIMQSIPAFSNTFFTYYRVEQFGDNAKPTDTGVINFFDSYVKGMLDQGYPVVLHIAQYNQTTNYFYDNYHSVVAYYYDEDGIHCNFGWGSSSTDVVIPSNYQITSAGVINFNHVQECHSNNFIVNQAKYCGCGVHTEHYYHNHYETYSSDKHKSYCTCEDYVLHSHAIRAENIFIIFGQRHAYCINCGTLINLTTTLVVVVNGGQCLITDNGSYILPNGILVIVESDIESYLSNTLIFHNDNEVTS